jgi:hypothetical protein
MEFTFNTFFVRSRCQNAFFISEASKPFETCLVKLYINIFLGKNRFEISDKTTLRYLYTVAVDATGLKDGKKSLGAPRGAKRQNNMHVILMKELDRIVSS